MPGLVHEGVAPRGNGATHLRTGSAGGSLRVPDVRRIAVLRANALGDLVHALPALDALRAAYPAAEITLLGREQHAELLSGRPGPVDRVVPLERGLVGDEPDAMPGLDREAALAELRACRFDVAVQLHGGGRNSNVVVAALDARVSAGMRTPDAPDLDRWIPYELYQSEVGRCLDIVRLVGAEPVSIEPRLAVTDWDREALARELPALGGGPWVVIHPGATDPRRCWPADRFAAVARALAETGRRVVVTGTPPERQLLERVAAATPRTALAADHLTLPALVGLLAGADLVVANDTGPLHLAMAVETGTVGIFWFRNLITAGPFSHRRNRVAVSWRATCPVCGAHAVAEPRCPHDPPFVDDVPVSAVMDAARRLLAAA